MLPSKRPTAEPQVVKTPMVDKNTCNKKQVGRKYMPAAGEVSSFFMQTYLSRFKLYRGP